VSEFDRDKLKQHFRDGARPTSEHYADLIDSMVNKHDDGFKKDPAGGLRVSSLGTQNGLLSFSKGAGAPVSWRVQHNSDIDLLVAPQTQVEEAPRFSLGKKGPVGINRYRPAYSLDVGGPIRSGGRIGDVPVREQDDSQTPVVADGNWHSVTPILTGCHALEIVAGVGGEEGAGHYALLHAIALNTYNPRFSILRWLLGYRSIRRQTAVFDRYADRLKLRWLVLGKGKAKRQYKLQIKTAADYGLREDGKAFEVRYAISQLWFDHAMQGSRQDEPYVPDNAAKPEPDVASGK